MLPVIRGNKRSASEPPARFHVREDASRRQVSASGGQLKPYAKHRSKLPQLGGGKLPMAGLPIAARAEGMRLRSEPKKHGAINHHLVVM